MAQNTTRIAGRHFLQIPGPSPLPDRILDRKSTRLNSSHVKISYAVFCLKKKRIKIHRCV